VIVRIITAGVQVYMPVGNHRFPVYCKKMKRGHRGTVTCLISVINKEYAMIIVTQDALTFTQGRTECGSNGGHLFSVVSMPIQLNQSESYAMSNNPPEQRSQSAIATGLALAHRVMGFCFELILPIGAGVWLDRYLGLKGPCLIAGLLLGFGISGWHVSLWVKELNAEAKK